VIVGFGIRLDPISRCPASTEPGAKSTAVATSSGAASEPSRNASMVRACAAVVLAEAKSTVPASRSRTRRRPIAIDGPVDAMTAAVEVVVGSARLCVCDGGDQHRHSESPDY
jgi:hypothetical protein